MYILIILYFIVSNINDIIEMWDYFDEYRENFYENSKKHNILAYLGASLVICIIYIFRNFKSDIHRFIIVSIDFVAIGLAILHPEFELSAMYFGKFFITISVIDEIASRITDWIIYVFEINEDALEESVQNFASDIRNSQVG